MNFEILKTKIKEKKTVILAIILVLPYIVYGGYKGFNFVVSRSYQAGQVNVLMQFNNLVKQIKDADCSKPLSIGTGADNFVEIKKTECK